MIIKLIDGDIWTYRAGFAAQKTSYIVNQEHVCDTLGEAKSLCSSPEDTIHLDIVAEPVENALHNLNTGLSKLIGEDKYELYLTGSGNFRKEIATIQGYKANRKDSPRPVHYDAIRRHMQDRWDAVVINGQEADDEIGIRAYELMEAGHQPVIMSIDKDLDMIEGMHYNWVKDVYYNVGKLEAYRNFFKQTLIGDRTDNIPGLPKVGEVKATHMLKECNSAGEMHIVCSKAWNEAFPNGIRTEQGNTITAYKAYKEVCELLWIRRKRK